MKLGTLREKITFLLILTLAIALRVYGQNWDSGFHLHPDERMLIMVTTRIHFFTNLNPDFFNYGSLPIYILATLAQFFESVLKIPIFNYTGLLFLGRTLSTIFDIFTLFVVFKIARFLFNKRTAFFALFVYAVAFFPIQNAHFFVVDSLLTFFLTATLYTSIMHNKKPSRRYLFLTALFFAAALATKITALVVYPIVLISILFQYDRKFFITARAGAFVRMTHKPFLIFHFSLFIFHFIFMPFAYIQFGRFLHDITLQSQMNSNAYIFPYTLQYVGTMPYVYYLKNIFLWGMGPVFSILACFGCIQVLRTLCHSEEPRSCSTEREEKQSHKITENERLLHTFMGTERIRNDKIVRILFILFYVLYFLVLGRSAVKFMRYMLPLYPFFAIFAGVALSYIYDSQLSMFNSKFSMRVVVWALCLVSFMYTLMFMHIYAQPNTRIQATQWIATHIPPRSTIALEHWDDQVPLGAPPGYYDFIQLPLYNQPDNDAKWQTINTMLKSADYIVIASNRLYVPITHLVDCDKYAVCFPVASKYYADLFSERRGFIKVKEFSENPQLTIGSFKPHMNDQGADESFTVYDHPKIQIFKKK